MIEVELPDGSIAEFPDGTAPETIKQALQKQFGAPQVEQPGMVEDMTRSAGAGLRQGVEGMVGMFGDANRMTGDAAAWLAGKAGLGEEGQGRIRSGARFLSPFPNAPTTDEIQSVTDQGVGEAYHPQTTAGEYARTVGQFAPAAFAGPGSVARKTAMAAVPAVASETAGQLTEGTVAEPYARGLAALAGGVSVAGRGNPVKQAAKGAPTRETLKQQTDALYNTMRDAGIKYDSNAFGQSVLKMARDLKKSGLRRSVADDAYKVVRELADDVQRGLSPDFDDINGLIQNIGDKARAAARAGDKPLAKAYGIIRDQLDDFERTAVMSSTKPMPKAEFNELRTAARQTALKNIKTRAIDEIVENADTYQSGREAGIRNGISNLLRSKKGIQLFRGDERKALLDVAQGRKALRTLSRFGFDLTRLSGNATFIPAVGAVGAGSMVSPAAAGALLGAGTLAKVASPMMTERALSRAGAAIRSGGLNNARNAKQIAAQNQAAMIRVLLGAKAGETSAAMNSRRLEPAPQ